MAGSAFAITGRQGHRLSDFAQGTSGASSARSIVHCFTVMKLATVAVAQVGKFDLLLEELHRLNDCSYRPCAERLRDETWIIA